MVSLPDKSANSATGFSITIRAIIIIVCAAIAYWPALHGAWLWDDRADISENPLLRNFEGLIKIWRQPQLLYDFYPLKYTVQWIEWQIWGDNPAPYHIVTLGLHITGALLFWRVLAQLGVRLGWLAALLFAMHPLTVESVAWNAELKNTLSLPPLLLSLGFFISFDECGTRRGYIASLMLFAISMLCKSSAAPFPLFLLLYLWWRHGRLTRRHVLASIPFFFITIVLSVVTIWFQQHRGMGTTPVVLSVASRGALISTTWIVYLWKCLWPVHPLPIYPQWNISSPGLALFTPGIVGFAFLLFLTRIRSHWSRTAILGLGWFILFLAPASGLFSISYLRFSWVMDHMAYLSLLGVIALLVAAIGTAEAKLTIAQNRITRACTVILCVLAAARTYTYAGAYKSEEALWEYTLRYNPDAWMAYNNLGVLLGRKGNIQTEAEYYRMALKLNPEYPDAHRNLGNWLFQHGTVEEALAHYRRAAEIKPDFAPAFAGMAIVYRQKGQLPQAVAAFERCLQLDPEDLPTRNQYALALSDLGRVEDAIKNLKLCLLVDANDSDVHNNLGTLLRRNGQLAEALHHLSTAVNIRPNSPEYRFNYGNALQAAGRHSEAIEAYEQALRLKPGFARAMYNLGISLYYSGQRDAAKTQIERARQIDPQLAPVDL
jgi:protein O-mannosyl-transferase